MQRQNMQSHVQLVSLHPQPTPLASPGLSHILPALHTPLASPSAHTPRLTSPQPCPAEARRRRSWPGAGRGKGQAGCSSSLRAMWRAPGPCGHRIGSEEEWTRGFWQMQRGCGGRQGMMHCGHLRFQVPHAHHEHRRGSCPAADEDVAPATRKSALEIKVATTDSRRCVPRLHRSHLFRPPPAPLAFLLLLACGVACLVDENIRHEVVGRILRFKNLKRRGTT